MEFAIQIFGGTLAGGAAVAYLTKLMISERLRNAIRHEYDKKLEAHKAELEKQVTLQIEFAKSQLKGQEIVEQAKWEIKRNACLDALAVIDAAFSNADWHDKATKKPIPCYRQEINVEKARRVCNELALSCSNQKVLEGYMNLLVRIGTPEFNGAMINDLRNVIREELGFGMRLNLDNDKAWISDLKTAT